MKRTRHKATPGKGEARINHHSDSGSKAKQNKQRNASASARKGKVPAPRPLPKKVARRTRVAKAIDSRTAVIEKTRQPKKDKAGTSQPAKQGKSFTERFAKSTKSAAQRIRIVEALRLSPKSSYDLRRLGCYQCPTRIKELRDRFGFNISTTRITLVDRDGYSHRGIALYTLVAEGVLCAKPSTTAGGATSEIGGVLE